MSAGHSRTETIDDADDARLDDYRALADRELRVRRNLFVVEGALLVRRLLASRRFPVRSLLVTPRALDALDDAAAALDDSVPLYVASRDLVRAIVGFDFHRGCLAVAARAPGLTASSLIDPPGARCLVGVEGLADPENVGGVFRNAMAFGVDGVVLSPGTADPLSRKAIRASAGGALTVPFARVAWPADVTLLRSAGYRILALTPAGDAELLEVAPVPRMAILLGAEDHGLTTETLAAADVTVRIAMVSGVDSLNVATAAGIALHHLRGQAASQRVPEIRASRTA